MANARFTSTLLEGHKGTAIEVPFDPAERWDTKAETVGPRRRGHRVAGKVNGVAFESAIVPRSRRFWLLIDDDVCRKAKLEIGAAATVEVGPAAPPKPMGNPDAALARVRKICLALPGTEEKIAWGTPTFRVHGRLFATFSNNHHGDGRIAVLCNAPEGVQGDLVAADPERFFVPQYVGVRGWIGIRLDSKLGEGALKSLVEQAYRMTEETRARTRARK